MSDRTEGSAASRTAGDTPTQSRGLFEQLAERQLTPANEGASRKGARVGMRPRLPYAFDAHTELERAEPALGDDLVSALASSTNEGGRARREPAPASDMAVAGASGRSGDTEHAMGRPSSARGEALASAQAATGDRFARDRGDAASNPAVTSASANAIASSDETTAQLRAASASREQVLTSRIVERLQQSRGIGRVQGGGDDGKGGGGRDSGNGGEGRTIPTSDRTVTAARPRVPNEAAWAQRRTPLMRSTSPDPLPSVEIHIGRIEIRADTRPAPLAAPAAPGPASAPTADRLGAYLRARNRGSRS